MPKALGITLIMNMLALELATGMDTTSPNEPIPKPACEPMSVQLQYKRSSPQRMTIQSVDGSTRGGCVRLSQIWHALGNISPLYAVDPVTGDVSDTQTGTWLLTEELFVEDGITLQVHGTSVKGGDADELRLLSNEDTFFNLRGYGGNLDFLSTKVFAWDDSKNAVDDDEDDGRSYVSVVSEVLDENTSECDGKAQKNKGEARMDIEDSEMAYLGYQGSESYGLTWKVRGLCKDLSNTDLFDDVNVYGNIYDSDIHHNRFGIYTYGHQQGDWRRNKMHDNSGYGFDPHDDSDLLTIHDNEVYNNMYHGIIASKRCNGVSIQGNEVYGGGEMSAGIFLHRSGDDAIVKDNYVHDNGDAGMAMLESFRADVSDNTFENNKYGVRFSVGCGDNVFTDNEFIDSSDYHVFSYVGSDDPYVSDSGRSYDNIFRNNEFVGGEESIKIKEADGFQFVDNEFSEASVVRFDETEGTLMSGNTGLDDVEVKTLGGSCFDSASDSDWTPTCSDSE